MPPPSRLLQQQAAYEKKKENIAKLLKIGSKPVAAAQQEQIVLPHPDEVKAKEDLSEPILETAARVSLGFNLYRDIDNAPIKVSKTIEQLASHFLQIPLNKVEVALLWPGTLRSLASIHAVSTISRWHKGDKRGVRTLIYPARANVFQDLNHAQLDRLALAKLYAELYEPPGEKNPKVLVPCREKDAFFTALRSVRSSTGVELQPTIGEVLPHYFSDQDFKGWISCDGDLLKNLKTRLGDVNHTKALNMSAIPLLASPDYAPDAVFALGWRTTAPDVEKALRSIKKLGSPNAILVDVTRAVRKSNPKWLRTTAKFLQLISEVWPSQRPGICIVADEPHLGNQIVQEITRLSSKNGGLNMPSGRNGMAIYGFPCASTKDGFFPANAVEPLSPQAKDIRVSFTDTQAAKLIGQVDRLKSAASDSSSQELLGKVSRYLSQLAALPSSTRVLSAWLNQTGMPMAVREQYTWPTYRAKLHGLMKDPEYADKSRLEGVIKKCDAIWEAYENGTPFARQLASLLEEHTGGTETCCVVFTRPTTKRLAERYFETYDGYPEGAGFEVLKDRVRMVVAGSPSTEFGVRQNETVIFAGLDESSLRSLILDDQISARTYLLLTTRNAAYLKATLSAIDNLPAFKDFSPRITHLLKHLPDFPDASDRQFFAREDFVLPTFSFEQGLLTENHDEDSKDPDAWELILDNGRSVRRNPGSKVYIFDPLYGYTQTRGFRPVNVRELQEGQRLFVMSGELREATEASLKEAGVDISHDKQFEASLHHYHNRVLRGIDETLKKGTLIEQARELRQLLVAAPSAPRGFPADSAIKNWLNVSGHSSTNFEDQTSQAPRQEEHFNAFAKLLGFNALETVYFWKAVIQPLRGARRADGRRVSDAYSDMLMEPESVVVHKKMKSEVVSYLFSRAEENVYFIEAIRKPELKEVHD